MERHGIVYEIAKCRNRRIFARKSEKQMSFYQQVLQIYAEIFEKSVVSVTSADKNELHLDW